MPCRLQIYAPTRFCQVLPRIYHHKRQNICFVCSVVAESEQSECTAEGIRIKIAQEYELVRGTEKLSARPIVVGFGPAGIFSAYILALAGLKPIVFERGSEVDKRI